MLKRENAALVLIDLQEKLLPAMSQSELVVENCSRLIRAAKLFQIPILFTEQYPRGLGATEPALKELLGEQAAIEKLSFSACDTAEFRQKLGGIGRRQLLVAGVETHVCVYQTVHDLLQNPYEVFVAADAVSSRTEQNRQIGIDRMRELGAVVTSTEMALFELLRTAEDDLFRQVSKIVK